MMKYLLTFSSCIWVIIAFGQDTTYYDVNDNELTSLRFAHLYQIVLRNSIDTNQAAEKTFYINGQKRSELSYSDYKDKKRDGIYKKWYPNGQLWEEIEYKNGKINGQLLTYWDNEKPKRIDYYRNDTLIEGRCFNPDGKDTPYYNYLILPEFLGGESQLMWFLAKNTRYPNRAREAGIQGRVVLSFIVTKEGIVSNIKVEESISKELDEEAIRVVKKMPQWKPGLLDGEPVNIYYSLPIKFILN